MQLRPAQLAAHLKQPLLPLYVVAGEEPLIIQESLDALRAAARKQGYRERQVLDADRSFDWSALTQAAASLSLFATRRLIEVNLPSGAPGDAGARALKALAESPVPDTVVLLVCGPLEYRTRQSGWYTALEKPPFNPPNWLFAPVWFALYVLIGIAGARTFLRDASSPAMFFWVGQMLLNWAWSPTWFSLHLLWPAFAIIISILALIVAFIVVNWKTDRLSAVLFLPYAAWVAFASALNLSIALLN